MSRMEERMREVTAGNVIDPRALAPAGGGSGSDASTPTRGRSTEHGPEHDRRVSLG